MKKYTDKERLDKLREAGTGACYDCGIIYGGDSWSDLIIPDEIWEKINPTYHEGAGLLCCNCIVKRLKELGYTKNVPFQFTSGPFSFSIK